MEVTPELIALLDAHGIGIKPINRDRHSISNEPQWELYMIDR